MRARRRGREPHQIVYSPNLELLVSQLPMRFIVSLMLAASSLPCFSATEDSLGPEQLYRLDRLPMFKTSVKIGSVSSYDRTGGNDDGFSGKYSFVRKDP